MKSMLLALAGILLAFTLNAQFEEFVSSKQVGNIKPPYKYNPQFDIHPSMVFEGRFFTWMSERENLEFVEYSPSSDKPIIANFQLDVPGAAGEITFHDIKEIGNELWVEIREELKAEKKFKFYFQQLDLDFKKLVGKPKFMGEHSYLRRARREGIFIRNSKNKKFFSASHFDIDDEGYVTVYHQVYDENFKLINKYEFKRSDQKKNFRKSFILSDKGRLVEFVIDIDFWEKFREGAKDLPDCKDRIRVYWKAEEYEIDPHQEGLMMGSSLEFDGEKLYCYGDYVGYRPKKSDSPAESGVSISCLDLEKESGEEIVLNETFPLVYGDFNKYLSKEKKLSDQEYYEKEGYYPLRFYSLGSDFKDGVVYFAFQRTRYISSESSAMEAITLIKYTIGEDVPEVGYLPVFSRSTAKDGISWFVKNGNAYFFLNMETVNVQKPIPENRVPRQMLSSSYKVSFCLAEVRPGDGYSFEELSNAVYTEKVIPFPGQVWYDSEYPEIFLVPANKTSKFVASEEEFRIYQLDFLAD